MTDWEVLSLEEAGVTLLDCDHKTPAAREAGRPYVGIPQMTTGRVIFETARKISEEDYIHWTRKTKYQSDDVIVSRRTNPGVTAVDDTGTDFALGQNLVLLRADGSRVRPDFLRWMVHTPEWWEQIDKYLNVGAVFSSLKCRDVPKFKLTVPPLGQQEKINSILRPISDKIELNRRMNETLEAMARALFRDWFVDFGPTRRQMKGATDPAAIMGQAFPPEKAAALAPLFPVKLGDDGLPEGWRKVSLKSLGSVVTGKTPSTKSPDFYGEDIPFLKIPDMHGKSYVVKTGSMLSALGASSQAKKTVPAGSVSVSCIATPGLVVLNHRDTQTNQQINTVVPNNLSHQYFTFWSCREIASEVMIGGSGGSVFHNMNKTTFENLEVAFPGDDEAALFGKVVEPLHQKILANEQENQTLAALRDLLLPILMSGEIRLKDVGG